MGPILQDLFIPADLKEDAIQGYLQIANHFIAKQVSFALLDFFICYFVHVIVWLVVASELVVVWEEVWQTLSGAHTETGH